MSFSIHTFFRFVSSYFRKRRMSRFLRTFNPNSATTILDVGGYPETWKRLRIQSLITVLNVHRIDYTADALDPPIRTMVGNGCHLEFPDRSFDIVFSNSVIEHLGTFERQEVFARECRRTGRHLWVQTPAKSFFIEPHLLTPFIHFLPRGAQGKLIRHFSVWGLVTRPSAAQVQAFLSEVRLLSRREMEALFPDCDIIAEKVAGLSKSYIAVRRGTPDA